MQQSAQSGPRRFSLGPGLALFLFLTGWFLLTSSGHTYSSDEETMLAVAESLVGEGSFALELDFLMNYAAGSADGQRYSRYGPGQSVALVPFVWFGQAVATGAPSFASGLIMRLFALTLPALVTAATALVLYAWARALSYSVRVALAVGLLYGLTTLAWPYSRTLFAEPLATLLLVLCAYGLHRPQPLWWAVAGLSAGAALAVKAQVVLAFPLLGVYAILMSWHASWPARLRAAGGRLLAGTLGALLPLGLLLLYNTQVFGAPFTTGYGSLDPTSELGHPWQTGMYGLLVSPGKGLLVFAPSVLLGLLGLGFRLRQQGRESLLAVGLLVVHLLFYSRLNYWHGDGSWGPRYLVFVVPFLMLPAAGLLATLGQWRSRLGYSLVGSLALVSFLIQLLPVLVNFGTYLQLSDQYARFFNPAMSPLVGHARLWGERADEWLLRYISRPGVAVLREGFSYSEGDRTVGELLPRWTYAEAVIQVYPHSSQPDSAAVTGSMIVGDHRPWPLERANFELLLNGELLPGERIDLTGEQLVWELPFELPATQTEPVLLTLRSDTWNPTRDTEDNPRNEDLGLLLQELELKQGESVLELREALPIPSPSADRRALWLWYYDTPNHHLFDTWWWYLQAAGLPGGTLLLVGALFGLPALACCIAGGWGLFHTLRTSSSIDPLRAAAA